MAECFRFVRAYIPLKRVNTSLISDKRLRLPGPGLLNVNIVSLLFPRRDLRREAVVDLICSAAEGAEVSGAGYWGWRWRWRWRG